MACFIECPVTTQHLKNSAVSLFWGKCLKTSVISSELTGLISLSIIYWYGVKLNRDFNSAGLPPVHRGSVVPKNLVKKFTASFEISSYEINFFLIWSLKWFAFTILWKKEELLSPSFNHLIWDFCLRNNSSARHKSLTFCCWQLSPEDQALKIAD